MQEITKLEDKYLVLKKEDLDRFFSQFTKGIFTTKEEQRHINKIPFNTVLKEIQAYRQSIEKKDNHYVVLNLDDEISIPYFCREMDTKRYRAMVEDEINHITVRDIAVALVNAILKAKKDT